MKNIFRNNITAYCLVISGFVAIMFSACTDEFFNEKAGDRITPDQHYKNIVDAEISMKGAIIYLQDIMPRLIILDGLRSDMMDVTPYAGADLKSINEHMIASGNEFTDPSDLYKVIININEVLANIDRVAERDRDFNETISRQAKGALIGMRAWTYLTLAQLYGQVAWIDDNLTSLPDNLHQTLLPKDALIDTLINQIIPYIHNNANIIEKRYDYYVNNKALLGELYLEKNDYANAAFYLKLACESHMNTPSMYKVDRTYQNAGWSSIFLNSESAIIENISVIPYSSRESQNNPLANWMGYNYDYLVKPSNVLIDSFSMQIPTLGEIPGDVWRGKGVSFSLDTVGFLGDKALTNAHIIKYAVDNHDPQSSDIIISRSADIHLKLAEALNRLGDPVSQTHALMLLNNGVNGINPKPAPYTRWTANLGIRGRVQLRPRVIPDDITGEAKTRMIEDLIIAERALELAFEGKRWNDLVRIANRRNEPEYLADKVAAKFGPEKQDMIRNKLMNSENWYLPVK